MESVEQTHDEAVAVISAAVAELTRRAVAPELAPFRNDLEANVDRWEGCVVDLQAVSDDLGTRVHDLRERADELKLWTGGLIGHAGELTSRAGELRSAVAELRDGQDRAADALSRVESAIRSHSAVVEAARVRDQDLTRVLQELRTVSDANTALLAQSNARREDLTTSLRTIRRVAVTGFAILFLETIAWSVAFLLHFH